MVNKLLRLFLIVISFLAASVGLASCSAMNDGNTNTTSDSTSIHNPTIDTTSDSSTVPHSDNYNQHNLSFAVISEEEKTCEVIGYKKYYNDERDNNIYIPKMWNDYKVTSIGISVFYDCTSLNSIVIPNSVTSIGSYAFCNCTSLSSIVIPDSVISIGDSAFLFCSSLRSVTIGNSVTSIGNSAFGWCSSLSSIVIPDSVTSIGDYAFNSCDSLSSIIVKEGNTVYDSREDCNAIIETSTNTLIAGCATTIIPDSVTSIGSYAFSHCTSLSSIVIPDSVTSIEYKAFYCCTSLSSIVIPDSVTSICEFAFYGCKSLSDVYYIGSEEQWNAISIDKSNSELYSATIHYNYIGK